MHHSLHLLDRLFDACIPLLKQLTRWLIALRWTLLPRFGEHVTLGVATLACRTQLRTRRSTRIRRPRSGLLGWVLCLLLVVVEMREDTRFPIHVGLWGANRLSRSQGGGCVVAEKGTPTFLRDLGPRLRDVMGIGATEVGDGLLGGWTIKLIPSELGGGLKVRGRFYNNILFR